MCVCVFLAATLLPLLSSIDQDSNVLLALRQFNRNQDSDDTDSDVIDRGNPGEAVELFKKGDQHASAGDAADADQNVELSLEDGKLKITSNSKVVEISLDELYDGSSGKDAGETKETNVHKLTKSVLNQVSEKYTQMFKKVLSRNDEKKIIYLRDFGGMQDAFTRIMLKSLIVAVEDLKQKGAQVVIIAGHSQNPESEDDLIPVIPNMKHFSVLPPLETEAQRLQWKAITERDGGRRNGEINSKLLVAVYRQKNVLGLNNGNDTKMFNGIYSMNLANIFQSVWSPSEVDRRVSTAIGHALENNRNHLEIADFLIAHDIVEELSASDNATIKKEDIGISGAKVCGDGSLDLEHLKKSCNEYERKLLSRVVDPCKKVLVCFHFCNVNNLCHFYSQSTRIISRCLCSTTNNRKPSIVDIFTFDSPILFQKRCSKKELYSWCTAFWSIRYRKGNVIHSKKKKLI